MKIRYFVEIDPASLGLYYIKYRKNRIFSRWEYVKKYHKKLTVPEDKALKEAEKLYSILNAELQLNKPPKILEYYSKRDK